ncbi:hypothetical protein C1N72_04970 [Pantoea ananatis]
MTEKQSLFCFVFALIVSLAYSLIPATDNLLLNNVVILVSSMCSGFSLGVLALEKYKRFNHDN